MLDNGRRGTKMPKRKPGQMTKAQSERYLTAMDRASAAEVGSQEARDAVAEMRAISDQANRETGYVS